MASAVLASRNESSWAQSGGGGAGGGGVMGKTPYSHTQLNPNPKKKQKQFHHTSNGNSQAVTQTASDDAYSFNQRPIESTTSVDGLNLGGYMTYNVVSYNKSELHELRSRLVAELEQIRNLKDRIESGQLSTTNPRSHGKSKKLPVNKRPTPSGSSKDPKKLPNGVENRNFGKPKGIIGMESMMKDCRSILGKLMKHKNGWIFNIPVDAEALGLHDYHQLIKRPMDLGTVKSNLAKNFYPTPFEFAADVRLTFNNALLYNPKTDQVHGFAEQLLGRFEEMFRPFQDKLNKLDGSVRREFHPVDELQGSSWNHIPTPERVKKPKATPAPKKQERMQNHSTASTPSLPAPPPNLPVRQQSPLSTPSPVRAPVATKPQSVATKAPMGKQPKPRAKDPNKREMSMEEKHKLGIGLQSLPQEKMPQLVQIIRKRNEHLAQDGDEIELDIEALDTETLWELDRFVTNWKKMVSKTKRQALMNNLGPPSASAAASAVTTSVAEADGPTTSEKYESFKKLKKGEVGDEDVEIEDDEPAAQFPPVEIEKDEGGGREQDNGGSSSSSSSSSGSSSSSDSDSGSSSGSGSDADDAHS
ncbi:hypothetical protein K7X08_008974 [Anisodus acutangulus]|uniref:Uncharacterized protein n=1 Tax=Anisodus acutangulus TaxID=402998 RepID=A0A9Q1MZ09_9SOLA|nr:hypothetical protein K7X08_008974 [Anisodus acutangulus]